MAIVRKSEAEWKGNLLNGSGTMKLGSGAYEGAYSFQSRFADGTGTNPEELIGAAHAGCYSMAFSLMLDEAGFTPTSVQTTAKVQLEKAEVGFAITKIDLITRGQVPNITPEKFKEVAEAAKVACPVSRALTGLQINLDAELV